MNTAITPLIAGNWKMNGVAASLDELRALQLMLTASSGVDVTVVICPPATLLAAASAIANSGGFSTGGQDCHAAKAGAHTGDVSAAMLADAGAKYVIVGHSERRANHGESDADISAKADAAIGAGLTPIICVGETEIERDAGKAESVVERQLGASVPAAAATHAFVVAYEPVWAIGTGRTPTNDEIAQMHARIRAVLVARFGAVGSRVQILYGGSLKPTNAKEILAIANVNGGLVGGASLLAKDFATIISAA